MEQVGVDVVIFIGGGRRSMRQIEEMLKQPEKFEFPAPKTLDDELYLKFIRFKQQQN